MNISFGFFKYNYKIFKKLDKLIENGIIVIVFFGNNLGGKSDFLVLKLNIIFVGGLSKDFKILRYSFLGKIDIYNLSENIEFINN